jgi:hypothetical protein
MNNIFNKIPLDIIRYEIIPKLTYEERTSLNLSLAPEDRKGYPLQKIPQLILSSANKIKFAKNNQDPFWSSIQAPKIIEYPRPPRIEEQRVLTLAEMEREERKIYFQLREGQRIIHSSIHSGLFEREKGDVMKCRCCRS